MQTLHSTGDIAVAALLFVLVFVFVLVLVFVLVFVFFVSVFVFDAVGRHCSRYISVASPHHCVLSSHIYTAHHDGDNDHHDEDVLGGHPWEKITKLLTFSVPYQYDDCGDDGMDCDNIVCPLIIGIVCFLCLYADSLVLLRKLWLVFAFLWFHYTFTILMLVGFICFLKMYLSILACLVACWYDWSTLWFVLPLLQATRFYITWL